MIRCYPQGLLPSQDPKSIGSKTPEPVFETHDIHDMLSVKEELICKEVFFFHCASKHLTLNCLGLATIRILR